MFSTFHAVFGGSISIATGPVNTSVVEGDGVICDCIYNGTEDLPLWRINGVLHSPSALPPGYTADKLGLYFQATQELNQSTYQCLFAVYNGSSVLIELITSSIGTVFVSQGQPFVVYKILKKLVEY